MLGNLWQQLQGLVVLAVVFGALAVVSLFLYYKFRGDFVPPCPWCNEKLSEVITNERGEQRQECANPQCDLVAIVLKPKGREV